MAKNSRVGRSGRLGQSKETAMSTITTDRGMTGGAMNMGMGAMGMMPGMMMPGMMMPGMMNTGMSMPSMPGMGSMMMPRCTIAIEKMAGGMKMTCTCDDKSAAMMLQQM